MRISDWSSDVCSSDLRRSPGRGFADQCLRFVVHGLPRGAPAIHAAQGVGRGPDPRPQLQGPAGGCRRLAGRAGRRSEEHTSELQSLMRISYAVFCLKKKKENKNTKETSITQHIAVR